MQIAPLNDDDRQLIKKLYGDQAFALSGALVVLPTAFFAYAYYGDKVSPIKSLSWQQFLWALSGFTFFVWLLVLSGCRQAKALLTVQEKRICRGVVTSIGYTNSTSLASLKYLSTATNANIRLNSGKLHTAHWPVTKDLDLKTHDHIILEEVVGGWNPLTSAPYYGIFRLKHFDPVSDRDF